MNFKLFREKLGPISDLLKSEGDKLRDAYTTVHDGYARAVQELRETQELPPHRTELEELLGEALAKSNAQAAEELCRIIGGWSRAPIQNRPDGRRPVLDALTFKDANANNALLRLLAGFHLQARLSEVVAEIPWPDGPDPATRDQRIAALEKRCAAGSAEITELSEIATNAGIKLR